MRCLLVYHPKLRVSLLNLISFASPKKREKRKKHKEEKEKKNPTFRCLEYSFLAVVRVDLNHKWR